jgi:hypothetical protein
MKNTKEPALSFEHLVEVLRDRFATLSDPRKRLPEDRYPLIDAVMAGLAMFHFQDPSFLQFQESLEKTERRSNLSTMFGVERVPKSTQMKTLLDGVSPPEIHQSFHDIFRELDKAKVLPRFRYLQGRYLVPIDGSDYFSSSARHCPSCLESKKSDGTIRYHHQILQAALVKPGVPNILPLASEEVRRQDGVTKQDCELNAAKRMIPALAMAHSHMDMVIIGDGLYSHVPFVQLLREHAFSFILVAKPDDHKALIEDLKGLREAGAVGRLEKRDSRGRRHVYEFCSGLILRSDGKETVNWFSYQLINESGKIGYENSWITDLPVNARTVEELGEAGRARWKIENEGFNTLKTQGYNIKHNFGHGEKHLSFVLFLLNILAFLIHEILDLRDKSFRAVREKIGSRKELWNVIRTIVRMFVFDSWSFLMTFFLDKKTRSAFGPT